MLYLVKMYYNLFQAVWYLAKAQQLVELTLFPLCVFSLMQEALLPLQTARAQRRSPTVLVFNQEVVWSTTFLTFYF